MKTSAFLTALGLCLATATTLGGCGSKDDNDDKAAAPAPNPNANGGATNPDGTKKQGEGEASKIGPGKYYLKAGTVEYFDTVGNQLAPQQMQITGDYFWIIEPQGGELYKASMTGVAKASLNNTTILDVNCKGAQDVYSFEITPTSALRNLKLLESGCPTTAQLDSAQQRQIEAVGKDSFIFTIAESEGGARAIVQYTFTK